MVTNKKEEEERILRIWTPILLRSILIASVIILVAGLFLMAIKAPDFYLDRYRAVQSGHLDPPESISQLWSEAIQGDPHSLVTLGLLVLTLVPIARVAFCLILFLKQCDYTYVAFTAYVLTFLIIGVVVGRIG